MRKWSSFDKKCAIILIMCSLSYKDISIILNRTERSIQKKLNDLGYKSTYRQKHLYENKKCKNCNETFTTLKSTNKVFCNKNCSINYLNKNRIFDYTKTKVSKCIICNCDVEVKNNTNYSRIMCDKCKHEHNKKQCKYCNQEIGDNYKKTVCDNCKPFCFNIQLYKKLKIYDNKKKLKTINDKAISILSNMYYNKKYSRLQISEMINVDKKTLYKYFIKNNFNLRTLSESISNAVCEGRLNFGVRKNQYKSGWHKTWNGNKVYYRSSYELKYCNLLDDKKVEYIMEKIRIKYWDSILKKERIAIPDFYLLDTNEIVEIKSNWTYDEQNMVDKVIAYKNKGYKVKLILEHKEYIM